MSKLFKEIPTSYSHREPFSIEDIRWVDLSPFLKAVTSLERQINEQKEHFATANYMNDRSNLVGKLSEFVVAPIINEEVNMQLLINGDGGKDFKFVDCKGVTYWRDPWLKDVEPLRSEIYACVGLDLPRERGWFAGFITREDFRKRGNIHNWGHGERLSISHRDLDKNEKNLVAINNALKERSQ